MRYNFDEVIDRHNTNALKTEACKSLFGTENVLPLWVADMDFATPDFILDAIRQRLEHPILGYSLPPKNFFPQTVQWISEHHHWNLKREWIGFVQGVVPGLSFAIQCLSSPGDEIIIQTPVYHLFSHVVKKNNRTLIINKLKEDDGKFVMDYDDLEQKITSRTKLIILCNPHNPGGRVWTRSELERFAGICQRKGITVLSDEIHADMVLPNQQKHTPFATVSDWAAQNTLTFMAPSKVFNMPGLISSIYIAQNAELRKRYEDYLETSEMNLGNIFAYTGAVAAYEHGEEWRKQMLDYVQGNIDYMVDFMSKNIPQIKPMVPEASFLVWLDCKDMKMETEDLFNFFVQKAGLGLNKGTIFGPGGEYHLRMNVACARSVIEKAMQQLLQAMKTL